MLVSSGLEAKIATAVSTAVGSTVSVSSSWTVANNGLVKWIENPSTPVCVSVAVTLPNRETFSTSTVSFSANISVFSHIEADPTGSLFVAAVEAVDNLIKTWQAATYQQAFTDLDTEDIQIGDVTGGGGNSPTVENGVAAVSFSISINGSYKATSNNN